MVKNTKRWLFSTNYKGYWYIISFIKKILILSILGMFFFDLFFNDCYLLKNKLSFWLFILYMLIFSLAFLYMQLVLIKLIFILKFKMNINLNFFVYIFKFTITFILNRIFPYTILKTILIYLKDNTKTKMEFLFAGGFFIEYPKNTIKFKDSVFSLVEDVKTNKETVDSILVHKGRFIHKDILLGLKELDKDPTLCGSSKDTILTSFTNCLIQDPFSFKQFFFKLVEPLSISSFNKENFTKYSLNIKEFNENSLIFKVLSSLKKEFPHIQINSKVILGESSLRTTWPGFFSKKSQLHQVNTLVEVAAGLKIFGNTPQYKNILDNEEVILCKLFESGPADILIAKRNKIIGIEQEIPVFLSYDHFSELNLHNISLIQVKVPDAFNLNNIKAQKEEFINLLSTNTNNKIITDFVFDLGGNFNFIDKKKYGTELANNNYINKLETSLKASKKNFLLLNKDKEIIIPQTYACTFSENNELKLYDIFNI